MRVLSVLLLLVISLCCGAARAQDSGVISVTTAGGVLVAVSAAFVSLTLLPALLAVLGPRVNAGSLKRASATEPFAVVANTQQLSGELLFPEGAGPFPAVVLAHGCAGNRFVEPVWGPFLRSAGYATFNIDSLGGRSLSEAGNELVELADRFGRRD